MTKFDLQTVTGSVWPAVAEYIEVTEAERDALKAKLSEHQSLAADAAKRAKVEITKLAQAGADVSALVAIVIDVATPIREREIAAKKAEVATAAEALATKQAELEAIQ
jgi:hypothetical protein